VAKKVDESKSKKTEGLQQGFSGTDLTKKLLKDFGEDQVLSGDLSVKGMPFGVVSLDKQIGTLGGGIPIGRITEIYGDFATGKSLLGLMAIASTQAKGGIGVLIDTEQAFNPDRAAELGVDTEQITVLTPSSQEQCYEMILAIVEMAKAENGERLVTIVWDSVSALASEYEIEKGVGAANMASNARVNSAALKQITGPLAKYKVTLILINQIRSKIGVMFGQDWDTTGGKSIKYYASLRMHCKMTRQIKEGDKDSDVIGMSGVVEITKNRFSAPFRKVSLELFFEGGIKKFSGLFDYLVNTKQLKPGLTKEGTPKSGFYSLEGVKETFSENTFEGVIQNYPEVLARIEAN